MSRRARFPATLFAAVLIALPLLIAAGLGTDFEVQPGSITPASPFSIALYNVTDGASLNITVAPEFLPPVSTSWCNFTNWKYSFSLLDGNVTVRGENTNRIQLLVRTGKTYQMAQNTGTGDITVSIPMEFLPDIYYDFRILYEVHDPKVPVRLSLVQKGVKSGPPESVSTPNIFGISEGTMAVQVWEGGKFLGSDEIRIGPPMAGTPGTSPTPGPTTTLNGTATPGETPPATITAATTPPATTVTTRPVTTRAPVTPPVTTPAPAPSPEPAPGDLSLVILIYAAVIIVVTIVADYFILKD